MWREASSTAKVRSQIGVPSAPLWIAVFGKGQVVTEDLQPNSGVFYVFSTICAFWVVDHVAMEKVEELGIGAKTGFRYDKIYRWSFSSVEDIVIDRQSREIRISLKGQTFKLVGMDEFDAVSKALLYLKDANPLKLQESDEVHRSLIMYPESSKRIRLMSGSESSGTEYVLQEIDGAIVTNERLFYSTSVVRLHRIAMIRRSSDTLSIAIGKGLIINLRCSPHRQGLVIRLWLAQLPIKAYWQTATAETRSPSTGSLSLRVAAPLDERVGFSSDPFEMKRQIVVLERLHKQFCAIDRSGDGLIEKTELEEAMGPVFACQEFVSCFFRALDTDRSGTITFVEFASGMCDLLTANVIGKIRFSFRMFDIDGDGCIEKDEMKGILKALTSTGDVAIGDDIMEEVCEGLFTLIDIDQSGVISGDEYTEALQSNSQVHELLRRIGLSAEKHSRSATIADLAEDMICFGDPDWLICSSITQSLLVGLNQLRSNRTIENEMNGGISNTGSPTQRAPNLTIKEPANVDYNETQLCTCSVTGNLIRTYGEADVRYEDRRGKGSEVVVWAPKVFEYLRTIFQVSLEDYQGSLGLRNIAANMLLGSIETLRQPQWNGRRFRFTSNNKRFTVEYLTVPERDQLLRMIPAYIGYMKQNPNSLLPRYVGVHSVVNDGISVSFCIVLNPPASPPTTGSAAQLLQYHVKGISGRHKDNELCELDLTHPFRLAVGWQQPLVAQITKDVIFLSASESVGYELVIEARHQPSTADVGTKSDFAKKLEEADEANRKKKAKKSQGGGCCGASAVEEKDEGPPPPVAPKSRSNTGEAAALIESTVFAAAAAGSDIPTLSIFHEFLGGVRGIDDEPIVFRFERILLWVGSGNEAQRELPPAEYRDRLVQYLSEVVVGDSEDPIAEKPELGADSRAYQVLRESGKKATLIVDATRNILELVNQSSAPLGSAQIRGSKEVTTFVIPFGFGESSRQDLVLRMGGQFDSRSSFPTFRNVSKVKFQSSIERSKFLTDYSRVKETQVVRGLQTSTARIFVATWNVGDAPPADLRPLLRRAFGCDLIVISAQECNYQPKGNANFSSSCEQDFFSSIQTLLPDYVTVSGSSMWTIRMLILVRRHQVGRISNIRQQTEATGIGSVMGNKGGIAVGLTFDDTSMCFVGSHLAAHLERCEDRNSDVTEIVEGVSGKLGNEGVDILGCYQHVFWCGDLNYRLEAPFEKVLPLAVANNYKELHQYDQLRREMDAGRVFRQFHEPMPTFSPTYRFLRDTDPSSDRLYDEWKHRIPSWCDRILHKTMGHPLDRAERVEYDAVHDVRSSDHSPVFAIFDTNLRGNYILSGGDMKLVSAIGFTDLRCDNLRVADAFGLSDPWITFLCRLFTTPVKEARTRTIWKTLSPRWPEAFRFPVPDVELDQLLTEYVIFVLRDADYGGTSDPLGQAVLSLDTLAANPRGPIPCSLPVYMLGERHGTLHVNVHLEFKGEQEY